MRMKDNTRIVFMGTPDFAVPSLKSLYDSEYSIELVITQKDRRRGRGKKVKYTPVKESALELDLEVYQQENILKSEILDIPKYGSYNVHGSLLPKYRGAAPINWAIINGEKETGVTIMEMEEGLDTGDMIISDSIDINIEDDTRTIHDKLS